MQIAFSSKIFLTVFALLRGAPVCMSMCCFRYCLLAYVFSQISHLYCSKFSSWHLIICVCKLSVRLKFLAHIWHVITLFAWTLRCLAKFPFLNTFPHSSHLMLVTFVLVQFAFGHKRFSTLTYMVKHGLDLVKSKIELALNMPKNNSYPIVMSK